MIRFGAVALAVVGLLTTGASAPPTHSSELRQQCQTQHCRDCVDECDRALDNRMADCSAQNPRPGEAQEMCFYWAMADHNMCLRYDCGL